MAYRFVKFEAKDNDNPKSEVENEIITLALMLILEHCEFIVTDYGTMLPREGLVVADGHRGPMVRQGEGGEFDWWYHIAGGYILDKNA